jgi:uncharacterized membrane protein YdbT with pleckstrin-like domain
MARAGIGWRGDGAMSKAAEVTLYDASPSMVRNHPIMFVLGILLPLWLLYHGFRTDGAPALGGLGVLLVPILILVYLIWWLSCRATRLVITDRRVTLRRGLLRKDLNEVRHVDIRNVRVSQGLLQRMLGVGSVAISTSAQGDIEIAVSGIPSPHRVRVIVDEQRG